MVMAKKVDKKNRKKRFIIYLIEKRFIIYLSGGTAPTPPPAKTHFSPTHPSLWRTHVRTHSRTHFSVSIKRYV